MRFHKLMANASNASRVYGRSYSIFDKFKSMTKNRPKVSPPSTLAASPYNEVPPLSQPFQPSATVSTAHTTSTAALQSYPTTYSSDKMVKISTLPNGLRIATADPNAKLAHVIAGIKAGPRYETEEDFGTAWLLQSVLGGRKYPREEFAPILENIGATYANVLNRDCMLFFGEVLSSQISKFTDLFADAMLHPDLSSLDELKDSVIRKMDEYDDNPGTYYLADRIHQAAYGNRTLGKPILTRQSLDLNTQTLQRYIDTYFRPSNMVIAATGVQHEHFIELIADKFQFDGQRLQPLNLSNEKAEWLGGLSLQKFTETPYEVHKQNLEAFTHMSCAFKGPATGDPNAIVAHLLMTLLGKTSSFSTGGPGKGIFSRLATNYNIIQLFDSIEAQFEESYDSGIFNINSTTYHNAFNIGHIVAMVQQMVTMADNISPLELSRTKNILKAMVIENMESGLHAVTNMVIPLVWNQPIYDVKTLCDKIDAITVAEIQDATNQILSSPLAVAVVGNIDAIPQSYDDIVYAVEKSLSIRLAPAKTKISPQ